MSSPRELVRYGEPRGKNRAVTVWADVTDVDAAASVAILDIDFHAFLESPIVLDEQATLIVREVLAGDREALADPSVPFAAV
jgi:hypothetical protein